MSKRVLIGLVAASMVAMWGGEANAFNTINGVRVKHSQWRSLVLLSWVPKESPSGDVTQLTHSVTVTVEFICKKKGQPQQQHLQEQVVTFKITKEVDGDDFNSKGRAKVPFTHDYSSARCTEPGFKKINGSELPHSAKEPALRARTEWRCLGDGCDDSDPGNTDPGNTVDTTCLSGKRNPDGSVPDQELTCTTEHAADRGNEMVESGEQCDGKNLNGKTCVTQNLPAANSPASQSAPSTHPAARDVKGSSWRSGVGAGRSEI